ncbi:MAG: hypothetical protein JOZ41_15130 [Chloroflexi bacterium]|nr:hypothetical protein [Chloroflexota bacterium]
MTLPSLLWPPDRPPQARQGSRFRPETAADLDLKPVLRALTGYEERRERFVSAVLTDLCADPGVIAYRADVVSNLLSDRALRERLGALLPQLSTLVRERQRPVFGYGWSLGQIVQRLGEVELYVEVALGLSEALEGAALHAPALQTLRDSIQALVGTPEFEALQTELPDLRARLDGVRSVTIGVNLADDLQPESATILSVDTEKIEGRAGLLSRLLGEETSRRGITRLRDGQGNSLRAFFPPMEADARGRQNALVEDLQRLLERVVAPVGEAIENYVWVQTRDFAVLDSELSFLLNGAALIERLRGVGLPVCRPQIAPADDRLCCLEESYNVSLALRLMQDKNRGPAELVPNQVTFDGSHGRVWILTGPNRGGKTTYIRAVGLAQLLFQAGLYAPARGGRMSPVDAVYTHFPRMEGATPGEGRLDEEAVRLAEIFREATPHSLILLNEVLSGTSTLEALCLARDAVRGLRLLGARAIYVTHLHELARQVEEINGTTDGDSPVGSLVAEVDDDAGGHRRTFRIRPRAPLGLSYASEIAEQHGISYVQLEALLQQRGLIS